MKKLLILTLLLCIFAYTPINAKDSNTTKSNKHEFKSDEDFFKKMAALDQRQKEAKAKTKAIIELGKTVDEVAKELGIED